MISTQESIDLDAIFQQITVNKVISPQVAVDLQTLNKAKNYRRWLYSHAESGVGSRILEIGSGVGNYTDFLIKHGDVWATDLEDTYIDVLNARYQQNPAVIISKLTLGAWDDVTRAEVRSFEPDTIICFNVLEHVEADKESVEAMVDCLVPGGRLIVIVPALRFLYSDLDESYGHYRRYRKTDAKRLMNDIKDAYLEKMYYFNLLGVPGWWINHTLLGRMALPPDQTQIFNKLIPVISSVERVLPLPMGLSLLLWIQKNGS